MIETIKFNDKEYPKFQSIGNASKFSIPFAKHYCKGVGVDVGFGKKLWKFPGAIGADLCDSSNSYFSMNLPIGLDYIYSSHCLEHLEDWVSTIEYWSRILNRPGGVLFLYLPHPDQEYWKPWNNRKHLHTLYPKDVKSCMESFGFSSVQVSERDLNHSYIAVGEVI